MARGLRGGGWRERAGPAEGKGGAPYGCCLRGWRARGRAGWQAGAGGLAGWGSTNTAGHRRPAGRRAQLLLLLLLPPLLPLLTQATPS